VLAAVALAGAARGADVLVEAEGFAKPGGWVVDQQFIDIMGSPYLLAHGLGKPVENASAEVAFPEAGTYHVWVRTKDWVPEMQWAPGRFQVIVAGKPLAAEFGTAGDGKWVWQDGGTVQIAGKSVRIELKDLTGFDGRCDAIFFTTDPVAVLPEKPADTVRRWRKKLLGLPETPPAAGAFDVVVVGGGVSGCSAAVAAARLGCKVALVQDRPVFGGNTSPEIGVYGPRWGKPGPFITGEIYAEKGKSRPSVAQRQGVLDAESNIKQFLGWHVFRATKDQQRIASVDALNIYTNQELRFEAPVFIDCTGDGWVGFYAGAEYRYGQEGRDEYNESLAPESPGRMVLGATLHWKAAAGDEATSFPEVPWAQAVSKDLAATEGFWTWEYGHHRDMIQESEGIRDYLLRSIYGAFATAKQKDPEKMAKYGLHNVNYILGKRESRRLVGDYVMTQMDCWDTPTKPDKIAVTSNPFDLHVPSEKYDFKIQVDERWSLNKRKDYEIPFRSLYSRNVTNLMMAGRCISVTHVAHSSTRVMNTGSQTGVAVGAAAFLCKRYKADPRTVGREHIKELQDIVFGRGNYAGALEKAAAGAPKR